MSNCVIKNAEFFNTAKRLRIPANNLEVIVHEYINNISKEFPTDAYIKSKFFKKPFITSDMRIIDRWREFFSSPINLSNMSDSDRKQTIQSVISTFGSDNIIIYTNDDNIEVLVVSMPLFKKANINDRVPEGFVSSTLYDKESYGGDLKFYSTYKKSFTFKKDADAFKDKVQNQYPNRIRVVPDKNNKGQWIVDIMKPNITDDKFKLYVPSEEIYEDSIYDINDWSDFLSEDDILSNRALEEQDRREQELDEKEDMLFQKKNLLQELDKLKQINRPLRGLGSSKKIKEVLKNTGVSPLIYNTITKAIELDSSLLDLKPYDLLHIIFKQQETDLADLYNKYLLSPINKELERHLTEFLERYHVDINVGNAIQKFGVAGAYDIINKIIYLANESDRNAITFTEEFAHAFVELMGAKVSKKPENADFTFLFANVENTKIYRQVYEEYKDTYLTKDGKPDIYKIKKEAIGQALATAINYKWEHRDVNKKEESGFWAKLKQWFENILKAFTGAEYLNFDSLINTIAEDIINNNHDRLQKVDSNNYSLINYSETIANQNKKDGGIAVGFMQYFSELGNIITGSLAYRLQGTVYRASLDALHDIDMIVPMEIHNIPFESTLFKNAIKNNKFGNNILLDYLKTTNYFKNILEKFPKLKLIASYNDQNTITINAIYCEDESISEQFIGMSGTFASRLDKFTEEQRNQIYLFDFFLKSEDVPYIEDKENNFKLALYSESFRGKLFMGRAKDIYDYQNYKLFEEFKGLYTPSTESMMFQKPQNGFIWNAEQSAAIREVSDFINRRLRGEEKQPFYTIQGKAGTGKTTIINEILRNIKSPSIYTQPVIGIGALSHKAKEVLTDKISEDNLYNFKVISKSIAGLLGAKSEMIVDPKTGEAVEKIVVDKDDFTRNSVFKKASVVFVDEASMVNEYILELIKEDTENSNVAVVFIGDIGQLPPIRSEADPYYRGKAIQQDKLSPVFEDATIPKSKLNIRVRQGEDSPVLAYADYYWDFSTEKSNRYPIDTYLGVESNITDNGALIIQSSDTDLTKQLLPLFERAKKEKNPNIAKIVAYTNAKVNDYNRRLHFALHPESAKNNDLNYQEGDLIMFLDNYQKSTKETIENASEGIVEKFIREYEYNIEGGVPIKIRGLRLKLNNGKFHIVPVLENSEENIEAYNKNLEDLKNEALKYKKGSIEAKHAWQNYFKYKNLCAKIGFGYAITSHKSQGSTYEVVAVDSENIEGVKPISYKSKARSIYTALTRASNVTIVNSSTSKALPPSESISDINDRIIRNKKKGNTTVTPSVEEIKKENANPPTSSRPADIIEPIKKVAEINLNGEQLNIEYTYISNEASDRLASSDSQGNILLYKLRGNNEKERLEFFFNYIFGKSEKTYSKQKTQIFNDLAKLGYTEQFIRSLITTPKEAFTFLLLHENQHILNRDHIAARNASEQEIYNIEYRATYNALRQLIDSKGVSNPEDSLKKNNAYKILNEIDTFNREHLTFDEKSHIYYIDGVPVDTTVTKVLHGEIKEDSEYLKISSTLGNVHDNIARDYLNSKNPIIKYDYPNMTEQDVKDFHIQLDKIKTNLDSKFGKGKYEIITDENLLRLVGRITIDDQIKTIAGTMDMLVIDSQGNFHIFDFKTNRANNHIEFTAENSLIYPAQVNMYGQMLSQNYGAKIGSHNLIQFNLKYDTPKGDGRFETGDVTYNIEQGQDQIFVIYDDRVAPIQNAYRKGALGSVRIYEPGKLYKIHENVEDDSSVLKGQLLPYKEVIPERLKNTLENKVEEASKETKINIYAGTGENADLSNFAIRPFRHKFRGGSYKDFQSVEQAFQFIKAYEFADTRANDGVARGGKSIEVEILETTNGARLRQLGREVKELNVQAWDRASSHVMKEILKESFEQNPQALQRLLDTGDAILTPTQDRGKWGTEFPRLLMEVREEFRQSNQSKGVIQSGSLQRKTYYGMISSLESNQIFVFGSNTEGRHGMGAAATAKRLFGAKQFQAEGLQGQSYAIITKDLTKDDKKNPSRTPEQIKEQIHKLYEYARQHPDKEFLVAYSKDGKNLNYYSNEAMAEMFASEEIPSNIVFEEGFNSLVNKYEAEFNFKAESVHKTWKEVMELLGGQEDTQAQQEVKDAIKTAKEGITFEEALGQVQSIFTKEEQEQIKEAIQKTPKKKLQVMSVSRYTDPVFFSKEIIKFLEENSKKDFTNPTRVNVIELWSKHDGMPMQDILKACKKYKVAPMVSFSITGLGDTALEKGVLKYQDLLQLIKELIDNEYLNPSTTTVRIDPILVGVTNMDDIRNIVKEAKALGIKKFVTSLVQSYGYLEGTNRDRKVISGINKALESEGKSYDWDKYYGRDNKGKINFKPKKEYIDEVAQVLLELNEDNEIEIETCAFSIPGLKPSACLDPLIIERVTGVDVTNPDGTYDRDTSRPECMCYGAHSDMFRWNEKKCFSSCAYCYAAHSGDSNLEYYNEDGSIKDLKYTKVTPKRTQDSETKNILSSYEFYSGAAKGGDTVWAEEAKSLGIKTKNYTEESWDNLSKEWQNKLSKEYEDVARYLVRPIIALGAKGGKLVRRDMMQADKADAIFAISTIIKPGEEDKKGYINRSNHEVVEGGTAYAVTRGILRGIPVYVFDQSDNQWKVWDTNTNSFITISEPILTSHAATIGTREINDSGRQAIKSILNNSINRINNVSNKEYSDTTYEQIVELFNKNPKKISIEMIANVFQKHNDKIEILSEEQIDFLNILYKALSQGTPITKNIIPNNTVYKVEKVNNTNDLYTGAVKITLNVNAPKYGRKESLSRILRDLDISNIIYLDGPIGPDFFNTIRWMKQAGLNESSNYRRVYIENNNSLIESAKSNGLVYNSETGEVYIPSFIVGLTQQELETIKQNDILLNSDLFTSSELRNLSKSAVFKVSEYITMLATQEIANEKLLGDDFKNYNFVGKDRIDIIETIGLNRLFNIVKERFFNVEDERTRDWNFETLDKAEIIYNNFDAFINLGYDALIGMEGVSKYAQTDISTDLNTIIDDKTAQEIQEIYGNSVEHWQVGFRQVSAFSSLSQLIKRTFEKMYVLDENGKQVINEFGFADTLSPQECVSKVLKWTQYSNSIQEMIDKIKYHQSTNPWVSQLLEKLESDDETFKSQFFSNFKKYFQKYSIIYKDEASDKVLMKMINESSYADTIEDEIKGKLASYAMGNYTLKNTDGTINIESLEKLKYLYTKLLEKTNKDPESMRILESIYKILDIPLPSSLEFLNNVSQDQFNTAKDKLKHLINSFESNKDKVDFNPLKGGEYKYLIKLSANILGENLEAVSYEAGKLYYSYVTPSYLNKLIGKLQGHVENYDDFIYDEYGKYPQFFKKGKYRSYWLQQLVSDENVRKHLDHKASLHYLGTSYTEKSPDQYIASIMQEYFYDDKNKAWAWYRIPMMSNKPSEEYIKFIRISTGYETAITNHLLDILTLEIDRMAAVKQRETLNKDLKIENFDTGKGSRFAFLDYLNKELDTNSELGQLIKRKVNQESLNPTEEVRFLELSTEAIKKGMENKYLEEREYWIKEGFLKETSEGMSVKGINLGDTKEQIENSLREFFWNDTFAAINILQLTITDIAYYENAEDLQKRLAQLHAPGMRGNLQAKDINGQLYTDGFHRSFILEDFKVESEIIPNLIVVRDQLLAKESDPVKKTLIRNQFEDILKEFKKVNVADAQAYSSPTSYRKKMGIFGKWSIEQENAYNEIKKGNINIGNLSILWQPLKPFVYSQAEQQGYSTVFDKLKVGYQFKNSEYLLIIADALLRAGNKPNKLSAIFDIMEESADKYPSKGIDTVQFKSAVKTGLSGVLNINNMNSEEEIKTYLRSKIYKDGFYSLDYVKTLPMEDFSLQQEVPGHFKGMQQSGSQNRILTVADFPTVDKDGKDILINVDGEIITVKEAKERYYKAISDNINNSYQELIKRFKLDNTSTKMQNIAISRVLQDAILKDARLGSDLLWACSVNKHGEFNIPLSDPTQSDRIQQLLNSIIKNNINKQEIAGGPVVQVSNYGTADELHIRYQDKNGNILMTEEEFNMENSPKEFVSKEGYKTFEEYLKANQKSVAYFECYVPIYDDFIVKDFGRPDGTIDIEAMEKTNPDLLRMIGYRIPTEAKYSMVPIKIKGFLPPNAGEGIMLPKEITTLSGSDFDIDKLYIMRYMFNREESFDRNSFIDHLTSNNPRADKNKINDILNRNLAGEEFEEGSLEMGIFDYYVKHKKAFTTVKYTKPVSGKHANNNTTISIQYAILTHENSLEQLFTPGNFNVPKKLGYLIDILKNMPNKELKAGDIDVLANYQKLSKEDIYTLKDQSTKYKNLIYSSVHVQFHKQNMVAGKLIGVFATGNVSHAFMSLRECFAYITEGTEFVINGKLIAGETRIDPEFDESGYRVSSNLASFLAASVDAVKDPILNLLNVNEHTANILMTLLRLGFDTETACLLLSQPVVTKVINTLALSEETSYIGDIINNMKKSLEDNLKIEVPANFNFTKEFFIENLLESNEQNDLYILNLLEKLLSLSSLFKDITHMTKYNSITSAVGPFASDTEYKRLQMMAFKANDMVTESIKEAVNNPILKAFRDDAYSLEQSLLGNKIIQASPAFKSALRQLQSTLGYISDKISNKFSDFFIDYIVNMGEGVFDMSLEHRREVIFDYPNQILKEKDRYPDNLLLKNIKYVTDNSGFSTLELKTRGLSEEQSQDITAHWAKLYKDNPELAIKIFEYNVIRGTFGFNPKTFTKLVPNILKQSLPKYIEKLSIGNNFVLPELEIENIINQFILNNNFSPAGTHNIVNFDKINEISEQEFYIKPKKKDRTIERFGVGNIIIDNVSYTAYFEKSSYHDTIKVSLVDSLGGNGKAIELNPNERFPKSIFKQDSTTSKQDNSEKRTSLELSVKDVQGILLSKLYNTDELQRISQYNLSDSNIRSKFFLSMQERYSKAIGRSLTFAERSFFWNNTESMQDIINLLASSNSSDYIKIIGDISTTLEDLKLCSN